ncbi:ABC transporter [Streptomyces purpurascens]|uniref:ABC transporter n=1 Tax=Streptomyces purpurascens TaxID=1924 RepID=A0ABZ1MPE1_STREF|nr:ABC transporter [Streptomyces purpurascens]MCE7051088.1 ABC transporter [Streptomyces purpurascens]GHA53444.1 ABC transporter [Streptomyces purpurascens]
MPRLSGDLIVAACRTLPLGLVAAAGGTGLLMAALSRTTGEAGEWLALPLLRVAILAFAMGLVFLLDDPARHTTATVPTPRPVRIALRVGLVAPVVAAWWTAALLLVPRDLRPPVADITLEAGSAFALAVAAAVVAVRRSDIARPGPRLAAGLLTSAMLALLFWPGRWALFVPVQDERWAAAHDRWAVVAVAALLVGVLGAGEPVRRWSWPVVRGR